MFKGKVAVVTGGANGIGKAIVESFIRLEAHVAIIDITENPYFTGDISNKLTLETFRDKVISDFGKVDFIIHNAPPEMHGINDCTYEQFEKALNVGITAPFYLTKLFMNYLNEEASIINISSTRTYQSQPYTESYTASKGGLSALTHALAVSLSGKARVNAISPGWIDTTNSHFTHSDSEQHPVKRIGSSNDIADMVMFLCSNKANFITGENITIDGGMTKLMIYHNEHGWTFNNG